MGFPFPECARFVIFHAVASMSAPKRLTVMPTDPKTDKDKNWIAVRVDEKDLPGWIWKWYRDGPVKNFLPWKLGWEGFHVTIRYGSIEPGQWESVRNLVTAADVTLDDLTFSRVPAIVRPKHETSTADCWFLPVQSEKLTELRKRITGLLGPPKQDEVELHLTLGYVPRV